MDKIAFLRNTPLFAGIDATDVAEMSRYIFEKHLKRGEAIVNDGGRVQALYFVAEGVIKTYKISAEDKEQVLSVVRPGGFFNETLLDNKPAVASAEALGSVLLYGIRKTNLRTIMRKHKQIANNLHNMLTWRIRQTVSLVEDLSFRSV